MIKLLPCLSLASGLLLAQGPKPLAQWQFDETGGSSAKDAASGTADKIVGLNKFLRGVAGNSIQFDGYTTHIERPWKQVPPITGGFTVESWIAVDAYPWNWVPIVDWQRDMQAGYLFGIDPYGRIGLHVAIAGSWNVLSSNRTVPLKRWTHVAATFDPGAGIALSIDGKPAGQLAATGAFTPPEKTDLLIGRVRDKAMPVPSGLIHPKHSVFYSIEAQLDELTIHDRALSAAQLASAYASVKVPEGLSSPWPVMPAGAPGPGRFGAYYETLRFQDTWDRPRRVAPASDVVVRFPQSGMRLVFWQGMNYVPAWVTENNKWYTDQFMEVYGKPQCPDGEDCEPMSDKQNRYSHVRILENTDARVVVHWRYALSESENYKAAYQDPLTGWFDWADEYWTVYPDGVAVRKSVLWSSHLDGVRPGDKVGRAPHEFQESIVLNGPGQWPEDNIHYVALTLAKSRLQAPAIEVTGLKSEGYQRAERAYLLSRNAGTAADISLNATPESPVVNPAFVIRNWNAPNPRVLVNGRASGRLGQVSRLEGTDLVIWLETTSTQPVKIRIQAP